MSESLAVLPSSAIAGDTETEAFDKAFMAPYIVCLQYGKPDGTHEVLPTKRVRDGIAWMFSREHEQIWFHNGPYDIACMLEWYPELADLIWQALIDGRVLDTMYLQRMIQIGLGQIGGPLGLERVAPMYGLRAPTKDIEATHPDFPGQVFDVRRSFGLWYGADEIPDPWHSYADYDGEVTIQLAARMVKRYCMPQPNQKHPLVRLEDLATLTRTYFGLRLSQVYGLRVNPERVEDLARAGRAALERLQEAAQINGFLKPVAATRKQQAAGLVKATAPFCPVRWESRPADPKKGLVWDRRAAKHSQCKGCKLQAVGDDGRAIWQKNTKALKAAVTKAYGGKPPLTEKKKDKTTGKMTGGGQVATSRHVLQDSQNEELMAWSEYNEWGALMSKDMKIFARGVVHTNLSVTNNLRPASSDPNILNFRRTSFYIGTCPNPECGYEMTIDPREYKGEGTTIILCPACEVSDAQGGARKELTA